MKLTINRQDIIDAFVARTGVEPHQIEINVEVEPAPVVTSLNNPAVRDALRSFFHQGSRKACGEIISRIDLIKHFEYFSQSLRFLILTELRISLLA